MWWKICFSPLIFSGVLKHHPFQSCPEDQPRNKGKTILTEVNRIHTWKFDLEHFKEILYPLFIILGYERSDNYEENYILISYTSLQKTT